MLSNMKLKTRLIVLNLSLILLLTCGSVGYLLWSNYNSAERSAIELIDQEAKNVSLKMQEIIDTAIHDSTSIGKTLSAMKQSGGTDRSIVNEYLREIIDENENYVFAWAVFEPNAFDGNDRSNLNSPGSDGQGRYSPSWGRSDNALILEHSEDIEVSDYYRIPKETKSFYIAKPATFELNGEDVTSVSFCQPIIIDNKFYGVAGVDISLSQFQKMNNDVSFFESGYGELVNEDGLILAHPDPDVVNRVDSEFEGADGSALLKRLQKGDSFIDEAWSTLLEKDTYKFYEPIDFEGTDINWSYTIIVPSDEMMAKERALIIVLSVLSILSILVISGVMYFNAHYVVQSVSVLADIIDRLAHYDLSFDADHPAVKFLDRKDETGDITRSIATMQQNFIALLSEVKETGSVVLKASEELNATSEEVSMSAEEVSNTIQELAHGATEQAAATESGALQLNELGDLMDTNQSTIEETIVATQTVDKLVKTGLVVIDELIEKTDASGSASQDIYQVIIKTNTSSEKIRSASETIASIADQTNLLALNAAIEAARAGEAGRGFAVVAEEIRKLAEQSTTSTKEIDSVVEELIRNSSDAVSKMEEVYKLVEHQVKSVTSTEDKYREIASAIQLTDDAVNKMKQSSDGMQQKKETILDMVQSLSAIAEETAASTEQVSASIQEQLAATQEVANASEQLSLSSVGLQENVEKFKL